MPRDIDTLHEESIIDIGVVAAAKFAASHRLESRSRSINFMLSLLAASVIVTSVLPLAHEFEHNTELAIFLAGLSASIFVLVLSLYQYGSKDDVNAEKFLQNAIKISGIRRRLKYYEIKNVAEFDPFIKEYDIALKECGVNHEPIDFTRARMTRSALGDKTYNCGRTRTLWDMSMNTLRKAPALAVISSVILGVVIFVTWFALSQIYQS